MIFIVTKVKLTGKCRKKIDGLGIFCWVFWEKPKEIFFSNQRHVQTMI